MNLIYFDVEWANNKNKSICQIGLMSENFETKEPIYPERNIYVNPNDSFDFACVRVHGITAERVKNEKTFNEVWTEIKKYFIKSVIVAHSAVGADIDTLVKNLHYYNIDIPEFYYIDTLEISRKYIHSTEVRDYSLQGLCEYFNIEIDNAHDAYYDACACADLLSCLIKKYNFQLEEFVHKYEMKDIKDFVMYVSSPEIRREINTLLGTVIAIGFDNQVNKKELQYLQDWSNKYSHYKDYPDVHSIMFVLSKILEDGVVTIEELQKLKRTILLYVQEIDGSRETLATQFLSGLLSGVACDAEIDEEEIFALQKWLYENTYLEGHYPYDKLFKKINEVLVDGIVTSKEKEELLSMFSELFSPIENLKKTLIEFEGKSFCLTGDFCYGDKTKVGEFIISKGGQIHSSPKKTTDYVVIGGYGSDRYSNGTYGSKVKKALEMGIAVIKEEYLFV